jgi:hypothetical protein
LRQSGVAGSSSRSKVDTLWNPRRSAAIATVTIASGLACGATL